MGSNNMTEFQRLTAEAMGYTDECKQCKNCKHFSPHDWDDKVNECAFSNLVNFPVSEIGSCDKFERKK